MVVQIHAEFFSLVEQTPPSIYATWCLHKYYRLQ